MKLKKILPLFVVLIIAAVSIFALFIFRSQHQELATPPENPKPISELKHGDGTGPTTIRSVAFSPDGQLLASGGSDGTIKLWDVTVEFELPDTSTEKINLRIIDLLGNIAKQEFELNRDATEPRKKP